MPYRRGNFSYVIDSSFTPFTLQEMLVPFAAYKDAYEKAEESYNELSTKAGDFKLLSEQLPEGSDAKALYEGYAKDLEEQAKDLSRNGLTAMNKGALTSLKRRFSGEIGTLQKAEAALKEYQKVRDAMDVQDSTGIYASETPTIDDFLPGKNFNKYRVSGKELYAAGAAASKAITSRMFGTEDGEKILQGQFLDFVQQNGMSPEAIERFRNDMSTNPALQNAIEGIAQQYGLYENLKDKSLERAKKSIINGVIDNAVYQVTHSPQKNLDYITPMEQHTMDLQDRQDARAEKTLNLQAAIAGMKSDGNNGFVYDPSIHPKMILQNAKNGEKSNTAWGKQNKEQTLVGADSGTAYKYPGTEGYGQELDDVGSVRYLTEDEYSSLLDGAGNIKNDKLRNAIGNGDINDYQIMIIPKGSTEKTGTGLFDNDDLDEDVYVLIPRDTKRSATEGYGGTYTSEGTNDIPQQ